MALCKSKEQQKTSIICAIEPGSPQPILLGTVFFNI